MVIHHPASLVAIDTGGGDIMVLVCHDIVVVQI